MDFTPTRTRSHCLVGDVHGQAAKLHVLLGKMGYRFTGGAYRHPNGQVCIFLGDLIDRGPEQLEVVEIVRAMVDAGTAICVLGNHELNAIGWSTLKADGSGEYLHPHNTKHLAQHREYLNQVGEGSRMHREHIRFFRTLPLAVDLGYLRAVHAWWYQPYVDALEPRSAEDREMSDAFVQAAFTVGSAVRIAADGLTKGLEFRIPPGSRYVDSAGGKRGKLRAKWWAPGIDSYRHVFIAPPGAWVDESPLDQQIPDEIWLGRRAEVTAPTFIGHYWLQGVPARLTESVACLDYSAEVGGPLVGYHWDGETQIDDRNFVTS